jgi:hypothetical protein
MLSKNAPKECVFDQMALGPIYRLQKPTSAFERMSAFETCAFDRTMCVRPQKTVTAHAEAMDS